MCLIIYSLTEEDIRHYLYKVYIRKHFHLVWFSLNFRFLSGKQHTIQIIPDICCWHKNDYLHRKLQTETMYFFLKLNNKGFEIPYHQTYTITMCTSIDFTPTFIKCIFMFTNLLGYIFVQLLRNLDKFFPFTSSVNFRHIWHNIFKESFPK